MDQEKTDRDAQAFCATPADAEQRALERAALEQLKQMSAAMADFRRLILEHGALHPDVEAAAKRVLSVCAEYRALCERMESRRKSSMGEGA